MEDLDGVVACRGAKTLLCNLPFEMWTVVTSCSRPLALAKLAFADLPISPYMITFSDAAQGKPHPEPYTKGAAKIGVDPTSCVVVEDSPAGVRAGKTANCKVIGLRTWCSDMELRTAGADWIVDSCADITISKTKAVSISLLV
jgi:mannitol-1-/sugar-/sorbitol-6-phosphatase